MQGADLAFAGIARQAELIASGEVSPRELVELYLERIDRLDPQLNAFRCVYRERALSEADQAVARRGAGDEQRSLLGVPIAIKDDADVAADVTAYGTSAHGGAASADSEVVRRLRTAGAIVIGKTHVPELMQWPFTETATFGATRNPWDPTRAPGGSSGGSAAAVAAGLVGAALGSDGAGSIRIPSAWCGLFGLKPQRGRVSLAPRPEAWHGLSTFGPIARTVLDAAVFLDAAAGTAAIDAVSLPPEPRAFADAARAADPGKLRIAYSTAVPQGVFPRLHPDWREALESTIELLRSLGHEVEEHDPEYGADAIPSLLARYLRGIHDDGSELPHPERLERRTRSMMRLGGAIPRALVGRLRARELDLARRLNAPLRTCEVLLTPAAAQPAPAVGRFESRGALWTLNAVASLVPFNGPWNVTGQPAASVPAGFDSRGMPLAVQLVGRPAAEATLISLAAQIEAARPWAEARPTLAAA
ncbi:MAG: amidase [Solirubrobacteraceae bacterium]